MISQMADLENLNRLDLFSLEKRGLKWFIITEYEMMTCREKLVIIFHKSKPVSSQ